MSRCLPVSKMKSTKRGKHYGGPLNSVPREGSKIREAYDFFQSHKGEPVQYTCPPGYRTFQDLIDYYGLDIRKVRYGTWVLAGEWFGRVYIDYIAERIGGAQ